MYVQTQYMQAKLPDINSAIVRHRTGALAAMSQLNYALAATELRAINALLPKDYKVKEDSKEYQDKVKAHDVMVCNNCTELIPFDTIEFENKTIKVELQLLYAVEKLQMWTCPKCKFVNPKDGSDRVIQPPLAPHYTGTMPEVPKKSLFGNKLGFKLSFEKWFDIALNELENKIGIYRTDYAAQQDNEHDNIMDEDDNANDS